VKHYMYMSDGVESGRIEIAFRKSIWNHGTEKGTLSNQRALPQTQKNVDGLEQRQHVVALRTWAGTHSTRHG